ncbi:MAG: hypothetical protein LBF22_01600 [Deltaproteobacteria bacterium]|jgi:hypothetical protein|nr:hypothetical protein [Deltaproteobacteria bacterium]
MSDGIRTTDFFNLSEREELNILFQGLTEIFCQPGVKLDPQHILEHITLVQNFEKKFKNGTSDPDSFFTISDIEALFHDYYQRLFDIDFKYLYKKMAKLTGENEVIKKKRRNTSKKE